ncbi:YtpR family tRNA-binding protein [Listeria costaricensis]|uniref:YtpR family tRNA-binding protein n=1 Tax=Listeria costaricensis TaxID=2026604 RepID=UPI000C074B2E|nr:DUF4479 family protein [Listeria costaricensis]
MIVNAFYNEKGIGDTLIITVGDIDAEKRTFERKGDVAKIYQEDTGAVAGYNVFHARRYLTLDEKGKVSLTEEKIAAFNRILKENGFEEEIEADLSPKFVVGYVKSKDKHPNADKLSICQVDVGEAVLQIVCGAPNVEAGQKVVVAKVGAVMPSGLVIKPSNLRGTDSFGMLCAARELAIPDAPQEKGILVLGGETETGSVFATTF